MVSNLWKSAFVVGGIGVLSSLVVLTPWALVGHGLVILLLAQLSFRWTWHQEGRGWQGLGIGVVQLVLFTSTLHLIYLLYGPSHFEMDRPPRLWDWGQLTLVHVLRAADFMDAMEGYGFHLQNIKTVGYLSGTPLVILHLLVDFFLFTALFRLFQRWVSEESLKRWKKGGAVLIGVGGATLLGYLIVHWESQFPFIIWWFVCVAMAVTVAYWPTSVLPRLSRFSEEVVAEKMGCFLALAVLGGWGFSIYYYSWQVAMGWIFPLAIGGFVAFALLSILNAVFSSYEGFIWKVLYLSLPLLIFTLTLGGFSHWVHTLHPQWFTGEANFVVFPVENLFRAIDVLDTSQIYSWNWWGGEYHHWGFASVVVSYRFLGSTFFYTFAYRLLIHLGRLNLLPMDKVAEGLYDRDPVIRSQALATVKELNHLFYLPHLIHLFDDPHVDVSLEADHIFQNMVNDRRYSEREELLAQLELCLKVEGKTPEKNKGRYQVVRALLGFPMEEIEEYIYPLLWDPDVSVCHLLMGYLGGAFDEKYMPLYLELVHDETYPHRSAIASQLAYLKQKDHLLPLLEKDDEDRDVQLAVAKYVVEEKLENGVDLLSPLLERDDEELVKEGLEALGELGDRRAIPLVVPFLKDEDWTVRYYALLALTKMGDKDSAGEVVPLLKDEDRQVRQYAVKALRAWEAKETVSSLIEVVDYGEGTEGSESAMFREDVLDLLGEWGGDEVVPVILGRLKDPHWSVRKKAVEICGQRMILEAVPILEEMLNDKVIGFFTGEVMLKLKEETGG